MKTDTQKYHDLIKEMITPNRWRLDGEYGYAPVPPEDHEKCLEAGVKRFDELFSEGRKPRACQMGAERAIWLVAKSLHQKRMKALDKIAPKIQARIRDLIQGKDLGKGFDLGYEVAAALKADGYTWQQVIVAMGGMGLPGNIGDGIQIGYTGLYD